MYYIGVGGQLITLPCWSYMCIFRTSVYTFHPYPLFPVPSQNPTQVSMALQVFHNLSQLPSTLLMILTGFKDSIQFDIQHALDPTTLSVESGGPQFYNFICWICGADAGNDCTSIVSHSVVVLKVIIIQICTCTCICTLC